MANIVPYAFKGELMSGTHNFSAGGNTFFLALYTAAPNTPCLLYTSPSPRDRTRSRMPSSA